MISTQQLCSEIIFFFIPKKTEERIKEKKKLASFCQGQLISATKYVTESFAVGNDFRIKLPLAFGWKFQRENVNQNFTVVSATLMMVILYMCCYVD